MSRRVDREDKRQIFARVDLLNECLKVVCVGGVEAKPVDRMRWIILPRWDQTALPLRCHGLSLILQEELATIPSYEGVRLIPERFLYKLEADKNIQNGRLRSLVAGWHFRYELNDKGPEHRYEATCLPQALLTAEGSRFPLYHMHVKEVTGVYDDLHYPIGEPERPLNLVFEIIRLIKDEFIQS